ncbi:hypothetical protein PUNSTDRAFT_71911 [Punctularia strigosozonata HHB-11173 SS5]|uniref:uncharacterized protein n=1 Tax=Punctularia strigosozonata (strain HHB-11173) TaxID=741275 RepID=UPI00044181E9|nr:uncharacterized protein PUNSTDRAFT_71911 [Punctularia strigosozonata HHB-11173 SS5]EIN06647.1 hypothetical protein PUNSTDRAFT_71911 [Punctularia strigosozonata HHB-11173 SS5]
MSSPNPFSAVVEAAHDDPAEIQKVYTAHRTQRFAKQRSLFLSEAFKPEVDTILQRTLDPSIEPGYVDPRHSIVLWARPPAPVRALVAEIQRKLLVAAPHLWAMPPANLHTTALEMVYSVTEKEISAIMAIIGPAIGQMTDYTLTHRTRLAKPMLAYDVGGVALTLVPAAGEGREERSEDTEAEDDDAYTYHHLRRDLFDLCCSTGHIITSRYVVPSAHITIGRFITDIDFVLSSEDRKPDTVKVKRWVDTVDEINDWLQSEYWPANSDIRAGGEWIVGEGVPLELGAGRVWYGVVQ